MMTISKYVLLVILGSGLVTWLPRVLPFVFAKRLEFPKKLKTFLSYIPMCILTALFVQSLLVTHTDGFPTLNVENLLASIPTLVVGAFSRNLMWTVLTGIISMAVLRLLM